MISASSPRETVFEDTHRRGLVVLLCFTFFMVTGFEMVMPLIIGHFVSNLGFAATGVAWALAVRKFSQQGLAILGGLLADRRDIRKLIVLGMAMRFLGFIFLGLAQDLPALFLAMIFLGLGGVLFESPYQTAIALLTDDSHRSQYFSLNNTVVGVASTVGPLLGALLLAFDFQRVCWGAAACFGINLLIAWRIMPPVRRATNPPPVSQSFKVLKGDRRYLRFVLLMIVFWWAASQIDMTFPLRLREISSRPESVSWMYAIYAAVTALFQYPLTTWLRRRYVERQIVQRGILMIVVTLTLVPWAHRIETFLVLVVFFTLGMVLCRPNQQSLVITLAAPELIGLYVGFSAISFAIGSGGGGVLGGWFFDMSRSMNHHDWIWYVFALIGLVALWGFSISHDFDEKQKVLEQ